MPVVITAPLMHAQIIRNKCQLDHQHSNAHSSQRSSQCIQTLRGLNHGFQPRFPEPKTQVSRTSVNPKKNRFNMVKNPGCRRCVLKYVNRAYSVLFTVCQSQCRTNDCSFHIMASCLRMTDALMPLSGLPDSSSTISTVGQDMTVFLECSLVIRHDFNLRLLIRPHIPKPKTQVSHFQNWKLGISKAYVVMVWKPYSKRPSCSQQTCRCTEWVERMQRKPRRQTGSVREVSGWTCSSSYCSLEELHTHTYTRIMTSQHTAKDIMKSLQHTAKYGNNIKTILCTRKWNDTGWDEAILFHQGHNILFPQLP